MNCVLPVFEWKGRSAYKAQTRRWLPVKIAHSIKMGVIIEFCYCFWWHCARKMQHSSREHSIPFMRYRDPSWSWLHWSSSSNQPKTCCTAVATFGNLQWAGEVIPLGAAFQTGSCLTNIPSARLQCWLCKLQGGMQ